MILRWKIYAMIDICMNEIFRYIYDIEMLVSIQIVSYTFTKARYISGHDYVNVESPH